MNHQNSQFENRRTDEQNTHREQYEYVFSTPGDPPSDPNKKSGRTGVHLLISLVTVVLCVTLSLASGAVSAFYVYRTLTEKNENGINAAPDNSDLYHSDPESILDKGGSVSSPYGSAGDEVFSVSQVVNKVEDTVVVIDVTYTTNQSWFGQQTSASSGSGVIISADGYILTCHHVVDAATTITVTTNSNERYEASLVGSDAASDLAVIKIEPQAPLVYAEQGCSADLVAGEWVVAIGNPLGTLGGTVTNGIISALERKIQMSDGTVMTLLQTNAAINSGNSGGGLFNLDGKLVGIVNAKYAAEGVEGLAFAIPIDSAYTVQLDLIQYGYVRGVIDAGLEIVDINFDNLSWSQKAQYERTYGIHCSGVYVVSSAYCADLKNADRIISVNGIKVNSISELKSLLSKYNVGDALTILASRDGVEFSTTLTLREYVPDYVTQS